MVEAPNSRIVIVEGIYALSEKLRPFMDLRVSITGGIHFDLVKRVLRDIQRAGQEPEEIIHQISETVGFFFFCLKKEINKLKSFFHVYLNVESIHTRFIPCTKLSSNPI